MSKQTGLLVAGEGAVVTVADPDAASPFVFICEHAAHRLPAALGTLGLSADLLTAHIAWDPGALAVARSLAARFEAALIFQNFSRLAYDCNRPPEAPDAMPAVSEIHPIPGNVNLDGEARQARVDTFYRPWQAALADLIATRLAAGRDTVLVTIHTFTPVYKGQARDVEIGILHDKDARLADGMLEAAAGDRLYVVRRNEPYGPADGVTHTLVEHGLANGLLHVMIEIRNDLVNEEAGQEVMAGYLSGLLEASLTIRA